MARTKTPGAAKRKQSGKPAKPISRGRIRFDTRRARGLHVEFAYRRRHPISDADLEYISGVIAGTIAKERRRFKWFFASFQFNVFGGLYVTRFGIKDEDQDWEKQWVSTKVVKTVRELRPLIRELLTDTVENQIRGRPAWLLRFKVSLFKNKGG